MLFKHFSLAPQIRLSNWTHPPDSPQNRASFRASQNIRKHITFEPFFLYTDKLPPQMEGQICKNKNISYPRPAPASEQDRQLGAGCAGNLKRGPPLDAGARGIAAGARGIGAGARGIGPGARGIAAGNENTPTKVPNLFSVMRRMKMAPSKVPNLFSVMRQMKIPRPQCLICFR